MIAYLAQRAIFELTLNQEDSIEIPKVITNRIPRDKDNIAILVVNVNFISNEKFTNIKELMFEHKADIVFIIEAWNVIEDILGYEKYIFPSKYQNTLFVRSEIEHSIDINGLNGFVVTVNHQDFNFVYIENNHYYPNLPNGKIFGDINWKSAKLDEPIYHEHSLMGRTGMAALNVDESPIFEDFYGSDHQVIIYKHNIKYNKAFILDKYSVYKQLKKATLTGIYTKPVKIRHNNPRIRYYSASYWRIRKSRPKSNKIFNANLFGDYGLKYWYKLYDNKFKIYTEYQSKIDWSRCYSIRSKACDTNGISVNVILRLVEKLNRTQKENLEIALSKDMIINSLLLKKREFNKNRYDEKDFRMICILPTYLKLVEMKFDNFVIEEMIRPNFIGFTTGQSVHSFIALLNNYSVV